MSAPFCGMLLADMGADVVKVERPDGGDETRRQGPPFLGPFSAYYLSVNRNKLSLSLNLRAPEGREVFLKLAQESDIIVENNRPGVMKRLGVGYEEVKAVNPGIIYCSISGFGRDGPYVDRGGYDQVVQALSGIMSVTGEPGGPPGKVGIPITDLIAGLYSFSSVLLGLFHRAQAGEGTYIDISMLDCAVSLLTFQAQNYLLTGIPPKAMGTRHSMIAPYQAFQVRDGYINIAAGNDRLFQSLCKVIGREELAADPRFLTNLERVQNMDELASILESELRKEDSAYWIEALNAAGVPCGPIYNLAQLFADPQVIHRQLVRKMEHPEVGTIHQVMTPLRMTVGQPILRKVPPRLGEDNQRVLLGLGYSEQDVARLREKGAI